MNSCLQSGRAERFGVAHYSDEGTRSWVLHPIVMEEAGLTTSTRRELPRVFAASPATPLQMKLQMKRDAFAQLHSRANDKPRVLTQVKQRDGLWDSFGALGAKMSDFGGQGSAGSAVYSGGFWSHPPGSNRRPADYEFLRPAFQRFS
jgi:hypothetical protein